MKVFKLVLALLIIIPLIGVVVYYTANSKNIPFESVCDEGHDKYTPLCENVGKRANTKKSMLALNDTDFGEIVGVSWRIRGGTISSPGQELRYSNSNSYYYIIGSDKEDYYFLRITTEIDPQ